MLEFRIDKQMDVDVFWDVLLRLGSVLERQGTVTIAFER